MDKNPLIDIVIATYNRPNLLPKAIKSVLSQTYQNFTINVVNDAGIDVKNIVDSFNDDRIQYHNHLTNKGLGESRNTGISNSNGDYIICLDDDDWFMPHHLEFLLNYGIKNGEYEIAYTDAICNIQKKDINGEYKTVQRSIIYSIDFDKDLLLLQNITPVLAVIFSRKSFNEVPSFNNWKVYEDFIMWIELSRKFDFKHIPIPTCEYVYKDDGTTMSSSRNEFTTLLPQIYKNNFQYVDKDKQLWFAQNVNEIVKQRGLQPVFKIN